MTPQQRVALTAAEAGLLAVNEALRTLRASLEVVEPPAPAPTVMQSRQINKSAALRIGTLVVRERYERHQEPMVLPAGPATIRAWVVDINAGGAAVLMADDPHDLLIDGLVVASAKPVAGLAQVAFSADLSVLAEGWHWLDVRSPRETDTAYPRPLYVRHGAAAKPQPAMPVITHDHGMLIPPAGAPDNVVCWTMVPAQWVPRTAAFSAREYPAISTPVKRPALVCNQLVPVRGSDIHRPTITKEGVLTTEGREAYFWSDFVAAKPVVALLDGPRGRGTVVMPTHLQVGRGGKVYFTDPWRVGKIAADGTVTTLAGYRSTVPPSHWKSPNTVELVGDWSAIPEARRGFHELWGMAWDERTLAVDESAQPIPAEGNEKPHIVGPVAFVADSQNNRICRLQWLADRHGPAKVTEFIIGLADPWDVVCANGFLYVSERQANRVCAYDADTGALLRVLVQGPSGLAIVDRNRFIARRASRDVLRAQNCVLPEGLVLQDGVLYVGSRAMEQVKRIDLASGTLTTHCNVLCDDNSNFVKLAISDGTFGPRGTIFVSTWSNRGYGFPDAYLPNGSRWEIHDSGVSRGGPWTGTSYHTACAASQGRLVCGGVADGLNVISAALPADQALPPSVSAGAIEYRRRGLHLTHGPGGWGHFGLPLPWSVAGPIDDYLRSCGHEVGG